MSKSISLNNSKAFVKKSARLLNTYRAFIFFIIVALLYSFIIWRINMLAVATPNVTDIQAAKNQNTVPHIDQSVVNKMQSLKDNSVNVQTLFENARNNPFNE